MWPRKRNDATYLSNLLAERVSAFVYDNSNYVQLGGSRAEPRHAVSGCKSRMAVQVDCTRERGPGSHPDAEMRLNHSNDQFPQELAFTIVGIWYWILERSVMFGLRSPVPQGHVLEYIRACILVIVPLCVCSGSQQTRTFHPS